MMSTDASRTAPLSAELVRHARVLRALRAHMTSGRPGLDWGAFLLLATLVRAGPQRQRDLAGCAMLDPSTVSRHVAQLVRNGFVERRPDPHDGRAVVLVPTPAGAAAHERVYRRRDAVLSAVLADWSDADLARLEGLLRRLNDDFENHNVGKLRPDIPSKER